MDALEAFDTLQKRDPSYAETEVIWRELSSKILVEEHAGLLELLVSDDVFRWMIIIGDLLPGLVKREDFSVIVRRLADQCAGDMASGPFFAALRTTGMRSPTAAKSHLTQILAMDSPSTRLAVGLLVSGIAIQDEGWARSFLDELLVSGRRAPALRVMESLLVDGTGVRHLMPLVLGLEPQGEEELRLTGSCLRLARLYDPDAVDARFVEIVQGAKGNDLATIVVSASSTLRKNPLGLDARKRIVQIALEEGPPASGAAVDLLASCYRDDPQWACEILTTTAREQWLTTHLGMSGEAFLFAHIRNLDRQPMTDALVSWIGADAKLSYQAPDALEQLYEGHEEKLLEVIHSWGPADKAKFTVRLKILQDTISGRASALSKEKAIKDAIELGRAQGADLPSIIEGETSPKWQALRMLQHLLFPVKEVDYDALFRNLDRVPSVRDFMGISWWNGLRSKAAKDNLLPHIFHRTPATVAELQSAEKAFWTATGDSKVGAAMRYRHLLDSIRTFDHWESVFKGLDPAQPGIGNLRRKLKNPPQVADALCEAEITSFLLRSFSVAIEPEINGLASRPDLLVRVLERYVVLEIYNPKPPREIQFASGTQGLSLTRIRNLVIDKYERQFKSSAAEFDRPVVIVINANGSTLDDYEFEAIFQGTPQVTFTIGDDGRPVDSRLTRVADHIGQADPETAVISGVLGYRRNLTDFESPRLTLDYYANPFARFPLRAEEVQALCQALGTRPLRP